MKGVTNNHECLQFINGKIDDSQTVIQFLQSVTLCSSGVSKEQDFENRLKEEAEEKKKMVEFKAQAPKVLDQAPFVPKASRKPLVEFQEFNLATNERAEVWEENEAKKAERNAE